MIAKPSLRDSRIYISDGMFEDLILGRTRRQLGDLFYGGFIWVYYECFPRKLYTDKLRGAYLEAMFNNTHPLRLEPYKVYHAWMYGGYSYGLWRVEGEVNHQGNRGVSPGMSFHDSYPMLSERSTFMYMWDGGWANTKHYDFNHDISMIKPATQEETEKFNAGLKPQYRRSP